MSPGIHPYSDAVEGETEREADEDFSHWADFLPNERKKEHRAQEKEDAADFRKRTVGEKLDDGVGFIRP